MVPSSAELTDNGVNLKANFHNVESSEIHIGITQKSEKYIIQIFQKIKN